MKKIIAACGWFLLFCNVYAQPLIIKGKLRCVNSSVNSTKGAENIVVVPAFLPSKATITIARPAGYFEFNTGLPIAMLQDKTVSIYAISHCASCKELVKRVFVSEDQDRQNRADDKRYVTIKDWLLNTNCQQAELVPRAADSVLNIVVKQPGFDLDKVSSATALTGAPAVLNVLTNLTTVAAATGVGSYTLKALMPGKIKYGQFLLASPLIQSANTGFNFSPSRDMSEAVFWNPSAIAGSRKPTNISLLTNVKNNIKAGGFLQLNEKISLGAGFIYTMQDEFRDAIYKSDADGDPSNDRSIDSVSVRVKEYAAFISPVYKLNNAFSVALTIKSVWQYSVLPVKLNFNAAGIGYFTDGSTTKQHLDIDISATYKINSSFQAGINLMNLAGTKLYADALLPGQASIATQKQRSLGLGLLYKWQRLNAGADLLITENGLYDASLGINYVPFNNALISAGLAVKQLSYSFAFRIKYFRIAYIDDNHWLINEKHKGKSGILNGRIYGGFIFDFK